MTVNSRSLQIGLAVTALGPAVIAVALIVGPEWADSLWPFETSRLTNLFLGSILATIVVPTLWVSACREWGALRASALFPGLMLTAMAVYLVVKELGDDSGLLGYAFAMGVGAVYAFVLMRLGGRVALQDTRRVPALVRASFAVFAAVLILAGVLLVAGVDNVLPWTVDDDTGVMVGFIFLGAASSYVYGALRPVWGFVTAPLLGFLAYDLILLWPLLDHFSDVASQHRTSLVIYVAVVAYSGALAAFYLLVRSDTRLGRRASAVSPGTGSVASGGGAGSQR